MAAASPLEGLEQRAAARPGLYLLVLCAVFWSFLAASTYFFSFKDYFDYQYYLQMAAGRPVGVLEPYASRMLGPWVGELLSRATGWPVESALAFTDWLPWAAVPIVGGLLLHGKGVPLRLALIVMTAPFPMIAARYFLVPDGWAAMIAIGVMLAAHKRAWPLVWLLTALVVLARDTTLLAVVLWALASRDSRNPLVALALLAGVVTGFALKHFASHAGSSNIHHLPEVVYILAKVPVNFAGNLLGMHPYTDTVQWCAKPMFVIKGLKSHALGDITQLGLCPVNPIPVVQSLVSYLFVFGLGFWLLLRRLVLTPAAGIIGRLRANLMTLGLLLVTALSPAFGTAIARLFVEAYPLLFASVGEAAEIEVTNRTFAAAIGFNLIGFVVLLFVK